MATRTSRRGRHSLDSLSHDELQQLENDIENLREKVDQIVRSSVDSHLKYYKVAGGAFLAGFLLFISLGLLTKGELFQPIVKSIYKPADIYREIEPNILSEVWTAVTSGTEDDYKRFVSKDEFYTALADYHTNLVRTFLIPNREPIVRAREIMKVGSIPEDVRILMGGRQLEGQSTSRCYKVFRNSEKQAILVIPESFEKSDYSWYDCAFGWPKLTVALNYNGQDYEGIELVGVRRNGGTKQLIVLLSYKAAKDMNLPGWEDYKANVFGKIRVSTVSAK